MGQAEKKTQGDTARLGVLSIPNVMLEAAGIPPDSDLIVEILPGVLLISRLPGRFTKVSKAAASALFSDVVWTQKLLTAAVNTAAARPSGGSMRASRPMSP